MKAEGTDGLPLALPNNEYDYAIIRLAQPVGNRSSRRSGGAFRGWLPIPDQVDANALGRIFLFQHPETEPQQYDIGNYQRPDPSNTRFWYSVNSAKGSSGGAAVDSNGRLVALHNACVTSVHVPEDVVWNQGVRIDRIACDLRATAPDCLVPLDATPDFWSLSDDRTDPRPVIGRTNFRQRAREMMREAGRRIMVVTGGPDTGVQYSIKILRRLSAATTPIAVFSPNDLQKLPPREFLTAVVDELGTLGTLDHPIPPVPATENVSRWIRVDLPKWLATILADHHQKDKSRYPAWIVINTVMPPKERLFWPEHLKDLLAALTGAHDSGQVATDIPQLRWLFLGTVPDGIPVGSNERFEENLSQDTRYTQDFTECLQTAWRSIDMEPGFSDRAAAAMARAAFGAAGNRPKRKVLADTVAVLIREAVEMGGGE